MLEFVCLVLGIFLFSLWLGMYIGGIFYRMNNEDTDEN